MVSSSRVFRLKKTAETASEPVVTTPPEREYSVLEASKNLQVVYDVVLRYIRDKRLPASKVAIKGLRKEWRIKEKDIEAFKKRTGQS